MIVALCPEGSPDPSIEREARLATRRSMHLGWGAFRWCSPLCSCWWRTGVDDGRHWLFGHRRRWGLFHRQRWSLFYWLLCHGGRWGLFHWLRLAFGRRWVTSPSKYVEGTTTTGGTKHSVYKTHVNYKMMDLLDPITIVSVITVPEKIITL